jgi:oxygen-independent coproporphyrinogen III oxidase
MPSFRSLYFHFPFCETKCHYCDFYSIGREKTRAGDAPAFIRALTRETSLRASELTEPIHTIFMGGGTPSMTPPEDMAEALAPLWQQARLAEGAEWTMEANPSSVNLQRLKEYRSLGVNRISMGVQSMSDHLLQLLGRVHSRNQATDALDAIFGAGFENVSVDLICGVPGQTLADLDQAIASLTSYPVTHLSCYLLTLPKGHALFSKLPDDRTQLEHLLHIDTRMTDLGFEHYEISNFAKPGRRARHNLAYWKGDSYLGFGPSAHSFDGEQARRWKNASSLHVYADRLLRNELPVDSEERLTPDQRELEKWLLALRLEEGFPAGWLVRPLQKTRAVHLQEEGLIELHPRLAGNLRLTPRGFALSDAVIQALAC